MKNPDQQIVYTALFVDDVPALLALFPPVHKKQHGHHMTIAFRPKNTDDLQVGRKHQLKIIGRAVDGKGDAVLVEYAASKNEFPHITISTAENVPPMYSNELLETSRQEYLLEYFTEPTVISVTEGYFDGANDVTT